MIKMVSEFKSFEYIVRSKVFTLLQRIYEKPYESILHYSNGVMTYSHVSKLVYKFRDDGMLRIEKHGRRNSINLTSKGVELMEPIIKWRNQYGV